MRHRNKINQLGRKSAHRKAMLSNMAVSLILHKRINTTIAKAKVLRTYVEPLITQAKEDTTHNRRIVFAELQDKKAVAELFREVIVKVGDRPGGYTRILRTGIRLGDNAEMCMMELVDYNESMLKEKSAQKKTSRRSRKKSTAVKATEQIKSKEAKVEKANQSKKLAVDIKDESSMQSKSVDETNASEAKDKSADKE